MNVALLIGKHKSGGVPGKNYMEILGRPLSEYPIMAAYNSNIVDKIFVSTDSPIIKEIANKYNAEIIDRPEKLAQSETPTESVFEHAYTFIKKQVPDVKYIFLMFANSPDILPEYWDKAVSLLDNDNTLDSVISVSKYNMFSPMRARKLNNDGTTESMLDLKAMGITNTFDRDAMGDCYFADFGVQVVRARCIKDTSNGSLPFKWLGNKQGTVFKDFGFDIDAPWQIPVIEYWLKEHGFSENKTPYDK
ncbi:cytidylyltransferase domain-containing protein [Clostridium sp.]|jgi:CMP-N-acetylneuraminic acid synthetase|uniref:acylneuraminate cytidylyltransferase family protein n=1 Tax=Clostridium sp. TaxID=1506 RepID=UPI003EEC88B2